MTRIPLRVEDDVPDDQDLRSQWWQPPALLRRRMVICDVRPRTPIPEIPRPHAPGAVLPVHDTIRPERA